MACRSLAHLPLEVHGLLVSENTILSPKDFYAIVQTNSILYRCYLPYLYEHVILTSALSCRRFSDTITKKSTLLSLVKRLTVVVGRETLPLLGKLMIHNMANLKQLIFEIEPSASELKSLYLEPDDAWQASSSITDLVFKAAWKDNLQPQVAPVLPMPLQDFTIDLIPQLKELSFDYVDPCSCFLERLAALDLIPLQALSIRNTSSSQHTTLIPEEVLLDILHVSPNLRKLDLFCSTHAEITNQVLGAISKHCTEMEDLTLALWSFNQHRDESGLFLSPLEACINHLPSLRHLTRLIISDVNLAGDEVHLVIALASQCLQLKEFGICVLLEDADYEPSVDEQLEAFCVESIRRNWDRASVQGVRRLPVGYGQLEVNVLAC